MSVNVIIALKLAEDLPDIEADYIGADAGALILANQGIHMKAAIGDFDSVHPEDMEKIRSSADEVVILNVIKNDTDCEAAVRYAIEKGYEKIWVVCRMGGRMDHTYVNFRLAMKYPGRVILYDNQNKIQAYEKGRYAIPKENYKYLSVFTDTKACITLSGMKYSLENRTITSDDIYTVSNEILNEEGILEVHEGKVLLMQCRDRT